MRRLRTPRLVLEPLRVAHAAAMFEVLRDPAIHRHLDHPPPSSVGHLRDLYSKLERRTSPDGRELWLNWIVSSGARGAMGYVQATVQADGIAWVAYVLSGEHWGHGFASEATAAMLDNLATDYGVRRFLATVEEANERSIRLLERLGFQPLPRYESPGVDLSPTERLYARGASRGPSLHAQYG